VLISGVLISGVDSNISFIIDTAVVAVVVVAVNVIINTITNKNYY